MTDQQSSPGADGPVVDLKPMTFQPIHTDDPRVVRYQALVEDKNAPRAPVYSLTVTAALPGSDQEDRELQALLNEMRAGFALLPEPNPEADTSEDPGPFDFGTQVNIELGLADLEGQEPVGVAATVETAIEFVPEILKAPRNLRPDIIPTGKEHYWTARGGFKRYVTVTPSEGWGSIRPPRKPVSVGHPGTLYVTKIIVSANKRLGYSISNYFNGPFKMP